MKRGRGADYFGGDASGRRKYYGIKRAIAFGKQFPLSQYSYSPMLRGSPASLSAYGASWKAATPEQRALRQQMMMSGRGLYKGRGGFFGGLAGLLTGKGWKAGSEMGDKIWDTVKPVTSYLPFGGALNKAMAYSDMANPIGQGLANAAGRGLYRGRGVYAANNLVSDNGATASSVVPQFNSTDLHTIEYSNREYVRDIFAPGTSSVFELQTWELNPGLPTSFPWLSQLAVNFEEYELLQLAYTFKSTVADFAASSGQVGQVLMCTQYNPDSGDFATKDEMMLYEGGMSCKTSESMIHGIECDPSKLAGAAQKYVRVGSIPKTEDLKNYDLGKTSLAVVNAPSTYANQQIGELWVSYTIRLRKPKIASGNAYNVRRDVYVAPLKQLIGSYPVQYADLLSGARNSLGTTIHTTGAVVPNGAGTDDLIQVNPTTWTQTTWPEFFRLTFPSDFSGCLRIRIIWQNTNSSGTSWIQPVSLAPATISRFKDIPHIDPLSNSKKYTHVISTRHEHETNIDQQPQYKQSDCELHVRIQPPNSGLPNIVCFSASDAMPSGSSNQFTIEITQYNTFLSVTDNGKNDSLDLIQTFSGQPAVYV